MIASIPRTKDVYRGIHVIHATQHSQFGLMLLLAGQLLLQLDFSIINVGLAAISTSLYSGETELELFVAAYGLSFAICLAMGAAWVTIMAGREC